jgi:hypothetical protein
VWREPTGQAGFQRAWWRSSFSDTFLKKEVVKKEVIRRQVENEHHAEKRWEDFRVPATTNPSGSSY